MIVGKDPGGCGRGELQSQYFVWIFIKEKQEFEKVTYREERIIGWDGHQTGILEDK